MDYATTGSRGKRAAGALIASLVLATGCEKGDPSADGATTIPRNPAPVVEGEAYRPDIDPGNFVERIDNPYLPLIPGTVLSYEGLSDGERETERFVVTSRTKTILGVDTTVVRDSVYVSGELVEDTFDWFAQDRAGNVWYFGEASHDYKDGKIVSTHGSWEAGVDGAMPGIVMLADPRVGDTYRQEFYAGEAEDQATVVGLDESVEVPYGPFDAVLKTEDRNPLDPKILENKYYAPGIGVVFEELVRGEEGFLELVDVQGA